MKIDGHCNKPGDYHLDDLIKTADLEERVYRFRCVEAWSMVIPWVGIPLAAVIKRAEPTAKATFVEMQTVLRPNEMPGLASGGLNWPYTEGLRMDEAMNPLSLLAVGLYGKTLMNQNGAPIRLVVPWKYGFKNVKSIVRIRFVDKMPRTAWNDANPGEYGFYSNVNPTVDHPRWSQATETRHPGLVQDDEDADVQRLRRPGRVDVCRHGPEEVLLMPRRNALAKVAGLRRSRSCRPRLLIRGMLHREPRRQPRRNDPARDRPLGAEVPAPQPRDHPASAGSPAGTSLIQYRRMLGLFAFFYCVAALPRRTGRSTSTSRSPR